MDDQENFRLCQEVNIRVVKRVLFFNKPAKTSRDTLSSRDIWYIILQSKDKTGIGECAPIAGLSVETANNLENALIKLCNEKIDFENFRLLLDQCPSLRFAVETACLDFNHGGTRSIFNGYLEKKIPINGLVWMNGIDAMRKEALDKIQEGFTTIKFKIGALNFDHEVQLISEIRSQFPDVEIRLDANGAFLFEDVMHKLERLSKYNIHSIEQPIRAGNVELMRRVVVSSPISIALDEELIGVNSPNEREKLLDEIMPHYIILKPTLHGGFSGCDSWIENALVRHIGWWATSALESNIGLNAIAQWTISKGVSIPQGLGTGGLFVNNIPSPLTMHKGLLFWDSKTKWDLGEIIGSR